MQASGIFAQPTDIFSAGVEESEYGMSVARDYHPSQKVNIMVDIPSMGNPNPLQEESQFQLPTNTERSN